jgi:hypothetical protein
MKGKSKGFYIFISIIILLFILFGLVPVIYHETGLKENIANLHGFVYSDKPWYDWMLKRERGIMDSETTPPRSWIAQKFYKRKLNKYIAETANNNFKNDSSSTPLQSEIPEESVPLIKTPEVPEKTESNLPSTAHQPEIPKESKPLVTPSEVPKNIENTAILKGFYIIIAAVDSKKDAESFVNNFAHIREIPLSIIYFENRKIYRISGGYFNNRNEANSELLRIRKIINRPPPHEPWLLSN